VFIGIGNIVGKYNSSSIDVDAQAFFNRVAIAGGTLSSLERTAVNQLVLDLKTAGIWSSMKAIYPFVGASAAACAQNLKSSSFTGSFSSGWTFASTGVTGNGTSAYMNTTITPNQMAQNSIHLSIYNRTNSAGNFVDMGCSSASNNGIDAQIVSRFTGNLNISILNSTIPLSFVQNSSNSLQIATRNSSNNFNCFDKTNKTIVTKTSTTPTNLNIYIGARNINNLSVDFPTNRECAFASIGDGLTDTQAGNFYNAVQTFNTTLSRQV
jgi:hypothetical protein